jgi:peptidoglycan-N-acetylglucosamine deacetylase
LKTFISTTGIIRHLYPSQLIWEMPSDEKKIYLTFDDGPTQGVTDKVLEILNKFDAKATFFCIGKNVEAHQSLFLKIKEANHGIGNHSWDHLNGKKVSTQSYLASIQKAQDLIQSKYFRPPYGRIRKDQAAEIAKKYKIIMWSALSGDYDKNRSKEACLKSVLKYTRPGSIIVFHDSLKAADKMLYVLPRALEYFKGEGYEFSTIDANLLDKRK